MWIFKCTPVAILWIFAPVCSGCGTEDCPMDCETKYKCVDRSDLCAQMSAQCENIYFRKCLRCACPKTCGVCTDGSSEERTPTTATTANTTTTTTTSASTFATEVVANGTSPPPESAPNGNFTVVDHLGRRHQRYPSAEIQVCNCNLWKFPDLEDYVMALDSAGKSDPWQGRVHINWVPGVLPTVVLKFASGVAANRTLIASWSVDKLKHYLNDTLEPAAEGGEGQQQPSSSTGPSSIAIDGRMPSGRKAGRQPERRTNV